jgi:hypothetical protein
MIPVIPGPGFRESPGGLSFQDFPPRANVRRALIHLNQAEGALRRQHRFMETQSAPPRLIEKLSRPQAIERLRHKLRSLTDADHCVCSVVGQLGIFCRGFQALSDKELRSKYHWIARKRPKAPREAIEELANFYHLGRQEVTGAAICCDFETREHGGCDGWNNFDNRKLEEFYLALTGEEAEIG